MATISYQDKVAINVNPGVADINKVKAEDMNEIKNVVNGNDAFSGIESISLGTDGYVRFNNGLQIAWITKTITGNFTIWGGSVYFLQGTNLTAWAKPFTEVYYQNSSADATYYWMANTTPTTTAPGDVRIFRINSQNNASIVCTIYAIGKWT